MYVKSIFSLYLYIQTARNYCPFTELRYIKTLGQANALVMDKAKYSECAPAAIEEPRSSFWSSRPQVILS